MANRNGTQNAAFLGGLSPDLSWLAGAQSEKISCSFARACGLDPVDLLGRHIQVEHLQEFSAQSICYGALVMAVQIGAVGLGIESQLLLRREGEESEDFVPVSLLTILAVYA